MSGRAYSMKEMKAIVEYLNDHKAYGEIKGRKIWMDMANSKVIDRTWQSLKETFLKRILPEIHNPYYKLSTLQISSFKQGYDVETRLNNKLEMCLVSSNSNKNGDAESNKEEPGESNERSEDKKAGEAPNQSNLRSSTETLVLETCYETAEEIRKDLQSSTEEDEEKQRKSPSKSIRELIIYSEPLTPMLQAVIDDFETDEEADEPQMQIVEQPEPSNKKDDTNVTIELSDSDGNEMQERNKELSKNNNEKEMSLNKSETSKESQNNSNQPENDNTISSTENEINKSDKSANIRKDKDPITLDEKLKSASQTTQNFSNITTDSLLPGNQEALRKKSSAKNGSKKRSASQEPEIENKKRILMKQKSISDTETFGQIKDFFLNKSKIAKQQLVAPDTEIKTSKASVSQKDSEGNQDHYESSKTVQDNPHKESLSGHENPCLESVSLYDEQLLSTKYTDSDKSENENNNASCSKKKREIDCEIKDNNNEEMNGNMKKVTDTEKNDRIEKTVVNPISTGKKNIEIYSELAENVVLLKSQSDSMSNSAKSSKRTDRESLVREQRNKNLSNVFGFSSGSINRNRRRRSSYRRRSLSHHRKINICSGSSDWTSDSGSEYVSSPHRPYGRKGRKNRKYLKPRSARLVSMEEEGGLFVMYGKKIYPVVKDGKIVKNYTSFTPNDNVDQEESYWKLKYVEEKKRTAELTKLLDQAKEQQEPNLPVDTSQYKKMTENQQSVQVVTETVTAQKLPEKQLAESKIDTSQEGKSVKLKFTKNNEEVQFEGHWSYVTPVLAQVAKLFQREPNTTTSTRAETLQPDPVRGSGSSTPIEEIVEKVNKRENEIAKEIEKLYEEEEEKPLTTTSQVENNVTKRKLKQKKSSEPVDAQSPTKRPKHELSKLNVEITERAEKTTESENNDQHSVTTRRMSRTSKITATTNENNTVQTRRNLSRQSKEKIKVPIESPIGINQGDDDDVRYKFPSPKSATKKSNSSTKSDKVTRYTGLRKSKRVENVKIDSSLDNASVTSVQSIKIQHNADTSSLSNYITNRKRISFSISSNTNEKQTNIHDRSNLYLTDDITSDSSNSFQGPLVQTITFQNSTIKSDVYNSESYQQLMNKKSFLNTGNNPHLENIEETSVAFETEVLTKTGLNNKETAALSSEVSYQNTDIESVSSVTLPTSPVLSIVENLSINRTQLNGYDNFLTDDKFQDNNHEDRIMLNEFIHLDDDASMPLMEQDCGIETSCQDGIQYHYNLSVPKPAISDSLVNKINTVNIQDLTLSETLNSKLQDLLLESTKKNLKGNKNIKITKKEQKKTKSKNRSSTPRKRQTASKSIHVNKDQLIEEEHMEFCSRAGRISCPPVITISEVNDMDKTNILTTKEQMIETPKRTKKDIIKVKITKPKASKVKNNNDCVKEPKNKSNFVDSGINNTEFEAFLQEYNDSVDLIHNHSETCISAHECIGDSIEIVDNFAKSVISLDSNSTQSEVDFGCNDHESLSKILAQELLINDVQDGSEIGKESNKSESFQLKNVTADMYQTSRTSSQHNSILTDDLSDEVTNQRGISPMTRWYLLSEDETSNTNHIDCNANAVKDFGHGAKLDQIFPVVCTVPDLSTITEISKEAE